MKVEMTQQHAKNHGININGKHVTELVWELFRYSIVANRLDCPWYKARQEAGAFFKSGSDKPDYWVTIEFENPTKANGYVNLINRALAFVDDEGKAVQVQAVANEPTLKFIIGLTHFYACPIELKDGVVYFTPNHPSMITTLVEKNLLWGNTFNPTKLPVDTSDLVWGLYQDLGQNGSDYITDKEKRKALINDLRSVADQLQTTL